MPKYLLTCHGGRVDDSDHGVRRFDNAGPRQAQCGMFAQRDPRRRRADDKSAALLTNPDGFGDPLEIDDQPRRQASGAKLDQQIGAAAQGPRVRSPGQ